MFEALSEPGQWYLDRNEGKLYYLPMPGEDPNKTEVIAPALTEIMRIEGQADRNVESLVFEGLAFAHNEWAMPANKSGSEQAAVDVLIGKASGNKVLHNHIHDFFYTGVSVGWVWGYGENDACGNIIEWNHIHDIGKFALSDLGGIYTLGVQPGTRLRFNLIHDVNSRTHGGKGIYPDEGSTDILMENQCQDAARRAFPVCSCSMQAFAGPVDSLPGR